jgi:hypothetical protein
MTELPQSPIILARDTVKISDVENMLPGREIVVSGGTFFVNPDLANADDRSLVAYMQQRGRGILNVIGSWYPAGEMAPEADEVSDVTRAVLTIEGGRRGRIKGMFSSGSFPVKVTLFRKVEELPELP